MAVYDGTTFSTAASGVKYLITRQLFRLCRLKTRHARPCGDFRMLWHIMSCLCYYRYY